MKLFMAMLPVRVHRILVEVAAVFEVGVEELRGESRVKWLADARHTAMYLIREHTNLSFPDIGRVFNRGHATVIHACQKVAREKRLQPVVRALEKKLALGT